MERPLIRLLLVDVKADFAGQVRRCVEHLPQLHIAPHCLSHLEVKSSRPGDELVNVILAEFPTGDGTVMETLREFLMCCGDLAAQAQRHSLASEADRYQWLMSSGADYMYWVAVSQATATATVHGRGCQEVTGYSPEDFAAKPHLWIEMVHPDAGANEDLYADANTVTVRCLANWNSTAELRGTAHRSRRDYFSCHTPFGMRSADGDCRIIRLA